MPELVVVLVAFLSAVVVTGLVRRYALARDLLDVPNARSSHGVSTPRGGGLAIVASFSVFVVLYGLNGGLALALLPPVLGVAVVGFWDDHSDLPARVRILAHLAAIAWASYWMGDALAVPWPFGGPLDGWPLQLFAVVALVWFLNLFNFMDGIDGLAAGEAAFVALAGAWFAAGAGQAQIAMLLLILGAASLGFLAWNWPPAKIFMGDVGSGFLGAALGLSGYASSLEDASLVWPWVILVAVFVSDATLTLLRRVARGERWFEAHRSHAYQQASRRWGHRRVTLAVLSIDLAWLLPLAWIAQTMPQQGLWIALLAYMPPIVLALRFGAGITEDVRR